jgi:hypothetical protein
MNSLSDEDHQTTQEEVQTLLEEFDVDGDGRLSFTEFVALFKDAAGDEAPVPSAEEGAQLQEVEREIQTAVLGGDPDMPPPTPAESGPSGGLLQQLHSESGQSGLAGKCALVTGAAGAIGSAVVRAFHSAGINVAMLDISADPLASLVAELSGLPGGRLLPLTVDIGSPAAIEAAVKRVNEQAGFGMPDILINVAGILSNNKLQETSFEEWQRVMNINVTSAFLLCQACCPTMAERGWGRVVNITSWAWKSGGLTAVRTSSHEAPKH